MLYVHLHISDLSLSLAENRFIFVRYKTRPSASVERLCRSFGSAPGGVPEGELLSRNISYLRGRSIKLGWRSLTTQPVSPGRAPPFPLANLSLAKEFQRSKIHFLVVIAVLIWILVSKYSGDRILDREVSLRVVYDRERYPLL